MSSFHKLSIDLLAISDLFLSLCYTYNIGLQGRGHPRIYQGHRTRTFLSLWLTLSDSSCQRGLYKELKIGKYFETWEEKSLMRPILNITCWISRISSVSAESSLFWILVFMVLAIPTSPRAFSFKEARSEKAEEI